jgi:hypothetical protein
MDTKRILYILMVFYFIAVLANFAGNKVKAQASSGMMSVATDCFKPAEPFEKPKDVGDASNCTLGDSICIDSKCGDGTIEVQRLAGIDVGTTGN